MRLFVSDVEDKPWFYDREMWPRYLAMLAGHRFNAFNLVSGSATTSCAASPTPTCRSPIRSCWTCRATTSARPARRTRARLAIWRRSVSSASRPPPRGLDFQLGLWMHGYEWENSPQPNYTIEGLTAENHGAVLPRRAHRAAARLPRRPRRHAAHPRRERRGGGQLRVLEDRVRRREARRPQDRDRHARQGHRPAHDRSRRSPPGCRSKSRRSSGPSTWACRITRRISATPSVPVPAGATAG